MPPTPLERTPVALYFFSGFFIGMIFGWGLVGITIYIIKCINRSAEYPRNQPLEDSHRHFYGHSRDSYE